MKKSLIEVKIGWVHLAEDGFEVGNLATPIS